MPEETATPVEAVETSTEATTPEPTNPEPTEAKPQPDWEAAYKGLQRSQNKAHQTLEEVRAQNRLLAETVKVLKEGQGTLLRHTVGEDEAKAIETRQQEAEARAAAVAAAQTLEQNLMASIGLVDRVLATAGLSEDDRKAVYQQAKSIDGAAWFDAVHDLAQTRLEQINTKRLRDAEEGLKAKTRKEIEAEAEALAQRQLKEAGVDKIDTGKGSSTSDFASRIARMDPNSDEFKAVYADALAGRLKTR